MSRIVPGRGSSTRLVGGAVAAVAALALSACSSSSGAASNSSGGAGNSGASSDAFVTGSKTVLGNSISSLIYSSELAPTSADVTNVQPTDLTVVKDWAGPTEKITTPRNKRVVLLSCAPGTGCQHTVETIKSIITSLNLGWTVNIIEADGTPQGFVTAFNSAIAQHPDVIVASAIADTAVGQQLAEARAKGIKTIASAVQQAGSEHYDAYVSADTDMLFALNALAAIGDSNGHARAIVVHDTTYPNLDAGAKQLETIFKRCADCKTYPVQWTSPQAQNPVQAQQIIAGALSAHPDAKYVILPYDSLGLPAVVAAVRSATTKGIKILCKDATQGALQLVASGQVAFDPGYDTQWGAYAAVDEMLRAAAGAAMVSENHQGVPIRMFTPTNAPADGLTDFSKLIDYKAKYLELWGLSK